MCCIIIRNSGGENFQSSLIRKSLWYLSSIICYNCIIKTK